MRCGHLTAPGRGVRPRWGPSGDSRHRVRVRPGYPRPPLPLGATVVCADLNHISTSHARKTPRNVKSVQFGSGETASPSTTFITPRRMFRPRLALPLAARLAWPIACGTGCFTACGTCTFYFITFHVLMIFLYTLCVSAIHRKQPGDALAIHRTSISYLEDLARARSQLERGAGVQAGEGRGDQGVAGRALPIRANQLLIILYSNCMLC